MSDQMRDHEPGSPTASHHEGLRLLTLATLSAVIVGAATIPEAASPKYQGKEGGCIVPADPTIHSDEGLPYQRLGALVRSVKYETTPAEYKAIDTDSRRVYRRADNKYRVGPRHILPYRDFKKAEKADTAALHNYTLRFFRDKGIQIDDSQRPVDNLGFMYDLVLKPKNFIAASGLKKVVATLGPSPELYQEP